MKYPVKGLFAALCALLVASAGAYAGPLEELESLSVSSPEEYGRAFDNAAKTAGAPDTRSMNQQQLKQMMLADLDSLRNIMLAEYAPAGWKAEQYGWDLDAEIQKAKDKVSASDTITVKDYQKLVRTIMNSPRDYHVQVLFNSLENSALPLRIAEAEGRYFIVSIDREALPESAFPFREGDELVGFDGRTIQEAIAARAAEIGMDNIPHTDRGLLADSFFYRDGFYGDAVPQGPAKLMIKPAGAAQATEVTLNWDYAPELVPQQPFVRKGSEKDLPLAWTTLMMATPPGAGESTASGFGIGDKEGFLPDFGNKLWEAPASSLFRAYVYSSPADGKKIGYVRIPTYHIKETTKGVNEFAALINEFNRQETDALVIDQLNNGGGYVLYMYALASMLTDKPLAQPKYRVTITQGDALFAAVNLKKASQVTTDEKAAEYFGGPFRAGYPADYAYFTSLMNSYKSYVENWQAGKTLTDPAYLDGIAQVLPHKTTRYTKPILLLINELDISCGDFFPAMMQDNKRAVLFGERTSGAGGSVQTVTYPSNLLGIRELHVTGSIAVRPDGQPIENLGVKPDIPYNVQPADLQGGFKGYIAAVNAAVAGLTR